MKSIFACKDEATAWSPVFEDFTQFYSEPLHEMNLTHFRKNQMKRSMFQINIPFLVEIGSSGNVKTCIDLSLSLFEPFTEDSPEGLKHGFYLNSKPFYNESESDLEKCIKIFQKVCIFTNIEEEFVLIKEIGDGSTSVVYLAENIERSQNFAVKCIKKSYLSKSQSLKNLANEIRILRMIDHKNICKLFSVYEDQDKVYLVMEYLPHGNLLKRASRSDSMNENMILSFMRSLLETLDYLHSKNLVHRDLKLENILMTDTSGLDFKLIDLGLAYNCSFPQNRKCGSPGYVAPEMLRDEEYDSKIDIFSAGVIFYILLHGNHPFEAKNTTKILIKNLECKFKIDKKVSQFNSSLLDAMMSPLPENRPSASQLLQINWLVPKGKILSVQSLATCINSNVFV